MIFLFTSTVIWDSEKCICNVYQFNLTSGRYKALLVSPRHGNHIKQIVFWKAENSWASLVSKHDGYLVEVLGKEIDQFNK